MIFFCIPGPDDQNRWNQKNCQKFIHRVIFAFWIQICNPNLCKSHTFWNTANIEKWPFSHDDQNWWNRKNCPKFFHGVIFALWIQICNPNYVNSIYFELQLILKTVLFSHTRTLLPKLMKSEKLPEILS